MTESREEEAVSLAREVVDDLPRENFVVLVRLMELLDVVLFHSEVNRMTSSNLATVFSPTCIRPENDDPVNILRVCGIVHQLFPPFCCCYCAEKRKKNWCP